MRLAFLSSLTFLTASCVDPTVRHSEDVSSRDIQIVLHVNGDASSARVTARAIARLPYSGYVELTGGDHFVLRGDGEPDQPLAAFGATYAAQSNRNAGRFAVELRRPSDLSLSASIALPPPFALRPIPARVRWSDAIALSWDRGEGDHRTAILVRGPCTTGLVRHLARDTGEYVINGGEIARRDPSSPCPVRIEIEKSAPGTFERTAVATAKQVRGLELVIEP